MSCRNLFGIIAVLACVLVATAVVSGQEKAIAGAGDTAVAGADTSALAKLASVLPPASDAIDDIALASARKVMYSGLGLVVRNAAGGKVSVLVHDAKGRAVISRHYASGRLIQVPTDGIPTGVYVYTVRIADSVYTKPFIITR